MKKLLVFAILLMFTTAQADFVGIDGANKWHAELMERFRLFEKLHNEQRDAATGQAYGQLKLQLKKLLEAKTRKDDHVRFQGWQDVEYVNTIMDECNGLLDWNECSKRMRQLGYGEEVITKTGKVARALEWKWVEIKEKRERMMADMDKDSRLMRLNALHFEQMRTFERTLSRAEGDAALAIRLGEIRKTMMKIYGPLQKYKDIDAYYEAKFMEMLKNHPEKVCEVLKQCPALAGKAAVKNANPVRKK